MSEEMKKNIDDAELNREQLEDAAGGIELPRPKLPTKTITCPKCGQETEIPLLVSAGTVIICTKCWEEI